MLFLHLTELAADLLLVLDVDVVLRRQQLVQVLLGLILGRQNFAFQLVNLT